MHAYEPISRDLLEELEMRAAFHMPGSLEFREENGALRRVHGIIARVEKDTDGEFLVTGEGYRVRLDHLVSLDGIRLQHWA